MQHVGTPTAPRRLAKSQGHQLFGPASLALAALAFCQEHGSICQLGQDSLDLEAHEAVLSILDHPLALLDLASRIA